jgi:predicted  nucleic acid-binding Zn-ribbon protein
MYELLRNRIIRLENTIDYRNEKHDERETRISDALDIIKRFKQSFKMLQRRVTQLEDVFPEENLNIVHKNTEKLRDILDLTQNKLETTRADLEEMKYKWNERVTTMETELHKRINETSLKITSFKGDMQRLFIQLENPAEEITDRQQSPLLFLASEHTHDYTITDDDDDTIISDDDDDDDN